MTRQKFAHAWSNVVFCLLRIFEIFDLLFFCQQDQPRFVEYFREFEAIADKSLKGQSHEKVGELRGWGISLGPG
jgi:hypothetical protein